MSIEMLIISVMGELSRNLERIVAILSPKSLEKCIVLLCGKTC